MTDQELRSAWLDTQTRLNQIEKKMDSAQNGFDYKRRTSLDNLAARYKRFAFIGVAMALCSIVWFKNHIIPNPYNTIIPSILIPYFLLAASMDYYLMLKIKSIDIVNMPVSTVCRLAAKYKKLHHIFMPILIVICCAILTLFTIAVIDNKAMVAGIITGFFFGLILGIRQYLKFMSDYKNISAD